MVASNSFTAKTRRTQRDQILKLPEQSDRYSCRSELASEPVDKERSVREHPVNRRAQASSLLQEKSRIFKASGNETVSFAFFRQLLHALL
jgi:hypothetical protein